MASNESPPKPPIQVSPQWVTPALLVSLIALMAVISFNLLTELRGVRSEIKADLGSIRTELKADNRDMKGDLRADIQAFRAERKDDLQKLRAEVKDDFKDFRTEFKDAIIALKSDNQEINNHIDTFMNVLEDELKDNFDRINNRIDQVYQLQRPTKQSALQ